MIRNNSHLIGQGMNNNTNGNNTNGFMSTASFPSHLSWLHPLPVLLSDPSSSSSLTYPPPVPPPVTSDTGLPPFSLDSMSTPEPVARSAIIQQMPSNATSSSANASVMSSPNARPPKSPHLRFFTSPALPASLSSPSLRAHHPSPRLTGTRCSPRLHPSTPAAAVPTPSRKLLPVCSSPRLMALPAPVYTQ